MKTRTDPILSLLTGVIIIAAALALMYLFSQ